MLVSTEITVIVQLTDEELPAPSRMTLKSDGVRLSVECESCGARRARRFVPVQPRGDALDYCLECMADMPDVLSMKIGIDA